MRVVLYSLCVVCVASFNQEQFLNQLRCGINDFIFKGKLSYELKESVRIFVENKKSLKNDFVCSTCDVGMDAVIQARRFGAKKHQIANLFISLCIAFRIDSEHTCPKYINDHIDTLIYIVDHSANLTSKRICSIVQQTYGCEDPDRIDWKITMPTKSTLNRTTTVRNSIIKASPLKVLQISDIHYDPNYTTGSSAVCKERMCCQPSMTPTNPEETAGKWSDYRGCDLSSEMINNTFHHILKTHPEIDYLIYTGDAVDHNLWDAGISRNSEIMRSLFRILNCHFDSMPIFPTLGNHDPHPVNVFSHPDAKNTQLSTQWIFDLSAEEWLGWLPVDTQSTITKGGYYTALVRPGLRIVALNSNVCFTINWWLIYNDVDPFEQLQWLVDVLLKAEKNNEVVHIISHVSSGDPICLRNYGREYNRIINRFSDTIAAEFNGHTHKHELVIFFNDVDPTEAVHVAFNGGSLTPYRHVNPNYVIYDVDPETYEVLDYSVYAYNLTQANLTPDSIPKWYKMYSFKQAYMVNNLRPKEISELAEKIAQNRSLAEQYFRFKCRESDTQLAQGCDDKCHINNICRMVTSYYGYTVQCERLQRMFQDVTKTING